MRSSADNFKIRILECNDFESLALEVFRLQAKDNKIYSKYLDLLRINLDSVTKLSQIPFLPIEAFKSNDVITGNFTPETIFKSSGTLDSKSRSKHHIKSLQWYHQVTQKIFEDQFCTIEKTNWLGLLPGYLDRGQSSLVEMVRHFMKSSNSQENFFIHDYDGLNVLVDPTSDNLFVLGVTHAILDWIEGGFRPNAQSTFTIIETGGMKGHGREPIRQEVHDRIKAILPHVKIISEYGMTELHSQAYSVDGKYFTPPKWMRVSIVDTTDPMTEVERGRTGRVQIIDLANIDSCAFISTSDLGRMDTEIDSDRFEIIGRFDNSEVRGCNLLNVD